MSNNLETGRQLSPFIKTIRLMDGNLMILDSFNSKMYKLSGEYADNIEKSILNNDLSKCPQYLTLDNELCAESMDLLYKDYLKSCNFLQLIILPTEGCNFRCTYCYENHENKKMLPETKESIINFVEKNISKYTALRIEWFGGEPLCNISDVNELSQNLIQICKKNKKPYYASMTTNGYLLDVETFRQMFLKNKILRFQITLDGVKETHDLNRPYANGKGTFDVVLGNLKNIRDNIKSKMFNIVIRCNITKQVMATLDEYVNLIENEFGSDERFEEFWKIAWDPDTISDKCSCPDYYCTPTDINDCLNIGRKLKFGMNLKQYMKFGNICYATNRNSFVIGTDGTIYKCTVAFDKDINHVGKLQHDGTMVLDTEKMNFWTQRREITKRYCKNCPIYPSCLGMYCNLNNISGDGKFLCSGLLDSFSGYMETFEEQEGYISKCQ